MSPVSSRSQKAGQPPVVVGPPAIAFPSLSRRIHAAASGSHALRLGQRDAHSDLCLTRPGKSSLSQFLSQPCAVLWDLVPVSLSVCAEVLERCVGRGLGSDITGFLYQLDCSTRRNNSAISESRAHPPVRAIESRRMPRSRAPRREWLVTPEATRPRASAIDATSDAPPDTSASAWA